MVKKVVKLWSKIMVKKKEGRGGEAPDVLRQPLVRVVHLVKNGGQIMVKTVVKRVMGWAAGAPIQPLARVGRIPAEPPRFCENNARIIIVMVKPHTVKNLCG